MHQALRLDVWLWVSIAVALLAMRVYPDFAPALNQDSFQYLAAANSALAGHFGYTSLVHFDVERSFGVLPAPLLTFPLGYPSAIALVSLAGVSTQTAALILSATSTVACIPLLAWIASRMGFSRVVCNAVLACFVLNGIVNEFGSAAMTEALFTFLALLGTATLVSARLRGNGGGLWLWASAGLAFGIAYFVRYAGLFFIVGLAILAIRHFVSRALPLVKGYVTACAVSGVFVMIGIARNMHFVGNWRGRDELLVSNPLWPALVQTAGSLNALFLGVGTGTSAAGGTFVPKLALCLSLAFGIVSLAWCRRGERSVAANEGSVRNDIGVDLLLLSATYAACMLYAGLTSAISYGTSRVFVPLVPLLLLLFGLLLCNLLPTTRSGSPLKRLSVAGLAISFCCYVYLNMLVIRKPLIDQNAVVAARLGEPSDSGRSPRDAILSRIGPQGAILANNGQAVGYALGVPTVSMVGHNFGSVDWNSETVRDTIQRFRVAAVVISAPVPGDPEEDDIPSPFVRQLSQGSAPAWLKLEHQSSGVLTYVPVLSGLEASP